VKLLCKTTKKYAPEVRERAVRMVLDYERDNVPRRATLVSISAKIGCVDVAAEMVGGEADAY
jgi:transposase-like protein